MNMNTICASVNGQTLRITKRPPIASGGVQQCRVLFTFSADWDGLTKAAIFADGGKKRFYQVLISADNSATVPWEVLTEKGAFWLGAEGVDGTVKFTSELVRYPILEGAREGGAVKPPTPGVYDEILDKIDILREDVDEIGDDVTDLQGDVADLQGNVADLQGDVTDLQKGVADLRSDLDGTDGRLDALDGRVDAAEKDIDGLTDQIGQISDKLDNLPEQGGGGVGSIVRFAPFDTVRNIVIDDQEAVYVDSQALIYDGHDYYNFQHDFSLPLAASSEIVPYVTEDKKHFALRLAASGSPGSALSEKVDGLSDSLEALSGRADSLESGNRTLSAAVERLEAVQSDGVPEYFRSQLEQKEEDIRQALIQAGRDRSAFLFLTDPHWDTNRGHSPALIRHIRENTPLRTLFCGGDVLPEEGCSVEQAMAKGQEWQKIARSLGDHTYCLLGDSDLNNGDSVFSTENELTDSQIFSWLQADMDGRSVTYGNEFCFWLDNFVEKTRYVALDTGRKRLTSDAAKFLVEALSTLGEGWHCIILTHLYQVMNTPGDLSTLTDFVPAATLIEIVADAYQDRVAGVGNQGVVTVHYDFTEAKGSIAAIIAGHLHVDSVTRTQGGIPVIQLDCDGPDTLSKSGAEAGTVNEQAVTAVVADYAQNTISCIRIGRGDDLTVPIVE